MGRHNRQRREPGAHQAHESEVIRPAVFEHGVARDPRERRFGIRHGSYQYTEDSAGDPRPRWLALLTFTVPLVSGMFVWGVALGLTCWAFSQLPEIYADHAYIVQHRWPSFGLTVATVFAFMLLCQILSELVYYGLGVGAKLLFAIDWTIDRLRAVRARPHFAFETIMAGVLFAVALISASPLIYAQFKPSALPAAVSRQAPASVTIDKKPPQEAPAPALEPADIADPEKAKEQPQKPIPMHGKRA